MAKIPPSNSKADVQAAFRDVWKEIERFTAAEIDLKGKRITNAGRGLKQNDYATIAQLPAIPDIPEGVKTSDWPACGIRHDANQNLGAAATVVTMSIADVNVGGMWVASAPSRITIHRQGVYAVGGCIRWTVVDAINVLGIVRKNGSDYLAVDMAQGSQSAQLTTTPVRVWKFSQGDYIELVGSTSSGARASNALAYYSPVLWAFMVPPTMVL